jgi:CRP/FNR family transcriptional regulator, cyclic AMP receptor protein
MSATVSDKPYELTAETVDHCQVNFVKREDFLRFPGPALRGVRQP